MGALTAEMISSGKLSAVSGQHLADSLTTKDFAESQKLKADCSIRKMFISG
jgi:hypothetical protein